MAARAFCQLLIGLLFWLLLFPFFFLTDYIPGKPACNRSYCSTNAGIAPGYGRDAGPAGSSNETACHGFLLFIRKSGTAHGKQERYNDDRLL